jgi:hypothetical protein
MLNRGKPVDRPHDPFYIRGGVAKYAYKNYLGSLSDGCVPGLRIPALL